ncbi:hypothetical protein [Micromonospora sp. NPDC049374]|uniref:hypothetical protein n=1 Tax=Micromonospora sp. NPDC049374 TaxID=3154352 RepID=UPI0034482184
MIVDSGFAGVRQRSAPAPVTTSNWNIPGTRVKLPGMAEFQRGPAEAGGSLFRIVSTEKGGVS